VFGGYVSMARFPMLDGLFQMCDPFVHMRAILATIQGMLQRCFRMGEKKVSGTIVHHARPYDEARETLHPLTWETMVSHT
jgi:hypothetical protein